MEKREKLLEFMQENEHGTIICDGGYIFSLAGLIVYEGTVYNQIEPECFLEDIIKVLDARGEILWEKED